MRTAIALASLLIASFAITGCGESEQVVVYKQGEYQGKPDTKPWDNAPLAQDARGVRWTQGNRESWETAIKDRQLTQHEYRRLSQ